MKVTGKLTKTEGLLLALAGAFLVVMAAAGVSLSRASEGADYTITAQRQAPETLEEEIPETPEAPETPEETGPVNVNTAGPDELDTLPGIGPALAQRIIDYREEHGPFQSLEELLEVKGIGEKTLEKFRDAATVGDVPAGEGTQGEEDVP